MKREMNVPKIFVITKWGHTKIETMRLQYRDVLSGKWLTVQSTNQAVWHEAIPTQSFQVNMETPSRVSNIQTESLCLTPQQPEPGAVVSASSCGSSAFQYWYGNTLWFVTNATAQYLGPSGATELTLAGNRPLATTDNVSILYNRDTVLAFAFQNTEVPPYFQPYQPNTATLSFTIERVPAAQAVDAVRPWHRIQYQGSYLRFIDNRAQWIPAVNLGTNYQTDPSYMWNLPTMVNGFFANASTVWQLIPTNNAAGVSTFDTTKTWATVAQEYNLYASTFATRAAPISPVLFDMYVRDPTRAYIVGNSPVFITTPDALTLSVGVASTANGALAVNNANTAMFPNSSTLTNPASFPDASLSLTAVTFSPFSGLPNQEMVLEPVALNNQPGLFAQGWTFVRIRFGSNYLRFVNNDAQFVTGTPGANDYTYQWSVPGLMTAYCYFRPTTWQLVPKNIAQYSAPNSSVGFLSQVPWIPQESQVVPTWYSWMPTSFVLKCGPNARWHNGACTSCGSTSFLNPTTWQCQSCGPGEVIQNGACASCSAGQGVVNGQCVPCGPNRIAANGTCIACGVGQTVQNNMCVCPTGQAFVNGGCVACQGGQIAVNQTCQSCPVGQITQNNQCVPCPTGQISKNNQCQVCPPGQFAQNNQCVPCPSGSVLQNGRCTPCPEGTFSQNSLCVPCSAGTVSLAGSATCTACPPGEIVNQNVCVACDENEIVQNGICKPCGPGFQARNGVCVSKTCAPGQVMQNDQCVSCGSNMIIVNGRCTACSPGQRVQDGRCVVESCPTGQTLQNGACVALVPPPPPPPPSSSTTPPSSSTTTTTTPTTTDQTNLYIGLGVGIGVLIIIIIIVAVAVSAKNKKKSVSGAVNDALAKTPIGQVVESRAQALQQNPTDMG